MRQRLSKQVVKQIKESYNGNESVETIAKKLGVSTASVYRYGKAQHKKGKVKETDAHSLASLVMESNLSSEKKLHILKVLV